jgi:hypothetical protein
MKKVNLKSDDFYTQRNNLISPSSACMPTARVMFYLGNGYEIPNNSVYSNDDYFMVLLNTNKAKEYCYKKYKWAKGKYPPNQVHGMYNSYLDKLVLGERISDFKTNLTFKDYQNIIADGQVIMTSGSFPNLDGHAFCIIGIDKDNLLLADPWGNFRNNYKSKKGYKIKMSEDEFINHVKPAGKKKKWGHILI